MALVWQSKRANNPERLKVYLDSTGKLGWGTNNLDALDIVFSELAKLVYEDVLYYERARKRHRFFSQSTRFLAWLSGTAGLLIPLITAAGPSSMPGTGWGYPLLAASGSLLLFNRGLGATSGHVRYAIAQFALENRITLFQLEWSAWRAKQTRAPAPNEQTPSTTVTAEGIELFKAFVKETYLIVQKETTEWGAAIVADMERLNPPATQNQGPSHNADATPKPPNANSSAK